VRELKDGKTMRVDRIPNEVWKYVGKGKSGSDSFVIRCGEGRLTGEIEEGDHNSDS